MAPMSGIRTAFVFLLTLLFSGVSLVVQSPAQGNAQPDELYFIDAHSQMPRGLDENKIIPLMDKAGIWKTILSARNDRRPKDVASFAAKNPDRILAAVRSKGQAFNNNSPKFKKLIKKQVQNPVFGALGETLFFHAKKGKKAPRIAVSPDSPQSQILLKVALEKKWPFIAHYEFQAAGWDKSKYMEEFETLARTYPDLPFVLIHMGQLNPKETRRLIKAHANVYFMMSHSNPITQARNSSQPWINQFEGGRLAPKWEALALEYPDRFILAFDNVWAEDWGQSYIEQADMWRKALKKLPPEVAQALAHANAEKLWKISAR